jgi:hypothetical protein
MFPIVPELNTLRTFESFKNVAIIWVVHLDLVQQVGPHREQPMFRRTSVLPNIPAAWIRSIGLESSRGRCLEPCSGGGLPINVSLSHEGSSSDSASRSQEDCEKIEYVLVRSQLAEVDQRKTLRIILRTLEIWGEEIGTAGAA